MSDEQYVVTARRPGNNPLRPAGFVKSEVAPDLLSAHIERLRGAGYQQFWIYGPRDDKTGLRPLYNSWADEPDALFDGMKKKES